MAVNRYYSSTAVETTLSSGIGSGTTSITVGSVSGFPVSYPYTLILDPGNTEELVSVTAAGGTTLTVTRGQDGTSAVAHLAGITIKHAVSARDFREPQEHIAAVEDVHGLAGGADVVGTSSTQTLTNKTLTAPTIADFTNANHDHADADDGGTIAHSSLTGLTTGDPHTQYQKESEKSAANGYASLSASTKVPIAELPTGTTSSTVSLGDHVHGHGALVALDTALSPTTVDGSTYTIAETDDFTTSAEYIYLIEADIGLVDPASAANLVIDFVIEYSTNSGGAWTPSARTCRVSSGGTGLATSARLNAYIATAGPTFRARLRASRSVGSISADVDDVALAITQLRDLLP